MSTMMVAESTHVPKRATCSAYEEHVKSMATTFAGMGHQWQACGKLDSEHLQENNEKHMKTRQSNNTTMRRGNMRCKVLDLHLAGTWRPLACMHVTVILAHITVCVPWESYKECKFLPVVTSCEGRARQVTSNACKYVTELSQCNTCIHARPTCPNTVLREGLGSLVHACQIPLC